MKIRILVLLGLSLLALAGCDEEAEVTETLAVESPVVESPVVESPVVELPKTIIKKAPVTGPTNSGEAVTDKE